MAELNRAQILAKYILKNKATIRETAKHFNMAKSTVHIYVSKKLELENWLLYKKVKKILDKNWEEKHIRGGRATKRKWEIKKG